MNRVEVQAALRHAQTAYQLALQRAKALQETRDEAIRAASRCMSHAEIREALGGSISRARIGQILHSM